MQRIANVSLPVTKTLDGKLLHRAWILCADVFLLHQKIKIKVEGGAHRKMAMTSSPQGVSEIKGLRLQTSSRPEKEVETCNHLCWFSEGLGWEPDPSKALLS